MSTSWWPHPISVTEDNKIQEEYSFNMNVSIINSTKSYCFLSDKALPEIK
jgi:hypothetical protein